jgi:uncharacterized protein involved in type VI secretion and phage assembly
MMSVGSPGHSGNRRETARHYGKYRGSVTDNQDPRHQARLRVRVPEILGDVESGWAMPCAAYAGSHTGVSMVPPVGAGVWVEFEAGEVSRPIWVGCWWGSDQLPTDESGTSVTPDVKIARSEQGLLLALHDDSQTIALSDSTGANILKIEVQQGVVTLKASTKVVVDAPQIQLVANATHPGVFGDQLMTYLTQLVTMANTHMHPGEMAGPLPVTPVPPVPPLTPPTPDLLSMTVTLG